MRKAIGLFLLLLSASFVQAAPPQLVDDWEAVQVPVKPFVVKDLDGRALSLADCPTRSPWSISGPSWCKPCIKELPELAAYHRRLCDRKDVVLLSLNVGEKRPEVEAFLKRGRRGWE